MAPSADWDEIKRLAADLQKAQLSSTVQRLSERNCVEIVTKLIELKLLDVIFTTDGKEYLTQPQLAREIKDELHIHGGRVNTVDLARDLNVDLSQINASVAEIVRGKEVQLVSGHVISQTYLEKIAREINEKLQQQGQITVGELTLQYDLPAELLQSVLERNLGKIIEGRQDTSDQRTFYTEEFITRTKAKIRGALLGLLKPTPIAVIINHCNLTDRLFTSLFDQMNAPGSLTGRQAGALYVPSSYTKGQTEWVTSFYQQNNYLEYDALTRLGISDPKPFVKRVLANEELCFLDSCVVGPQIKERIETSLEDCISSKSYVDVVSMLPSVLSDSDIEMLLEVALKNNSKSTVLFENTVFSNHYLESLSEQCNPMVLKKAEEVVKSGKYQQFFVDKQLGIKTDSSQQHVDYKAERREERRRKAGSGKVGGGTQGRETKTKAVKKHSRSSKNTADSDSDDGAASATKKDPMVLEVVTTRDVEEAIRGTLEQEGLDELLAPIAQHLHGKLNQAAISMAKEAADKLVQNASQSRKQTHSASQDTINVLVNDLKLYERGIKLFPSDQQVQFVKYMLKTLGGDIVSEFCKYAASQCNMKLPEEFTAEQRNKIIKDLSEDYVKPLQALNAALAEQTVEPFFKALDICLMECGMILKKVDKKKDRLTIHNHKENLLSELSRCEEPALVLHLAALAMFTGATQSMLHASGRQVPAVIAFLSGHLEEVARDTLHSYHETVTKFLTTTDEETRAELQKMLQSEMTKIKQIVNEVKKQ